MGARILDGRAVAQKLTQALLARLRAVEKLLERPPKLALVRCASRAPTQGPGPSAEIFFHQQRSACERIGIAAEVVRIDPCGGTPALAQRLRTLSASTEVDGILVEFPLPPPIDAAIALAALEPVKDVEGLTPHCRGLFYGCKSLEELRRSAAYVPCTGLALMRLLRETGVETSGARALVIGRSNVVGRPAAHLLSCLDATVTLAHSKTKDLAALCSQADILVSAAGRPGLVQEAMVKEGAVVLDAGTTWDGQRLVGDVDTEGVSRRASWITPVPGGVGPVTVAELLNAVVTAAERRAGIKKGIEGLWD